ncbi:phosphotransferase enzyme family protein [Fonsecaea pedrosoi]|nr:phosphotransferase enzyme family protein [Fonsecaea pedrosoi]
MSSYGNLYFATDAFPGCEKAEIDGNAMQWEREETSKRFVIGPVVDTQFWSQGRDAIDIDRSPWKKPEDYLKAIGHREISWIRQYATPKPSHGPFSVSRAQNTPSSHVALYEKFLAVADSLLPKKQDLVRSTLWHWDIHAPNLFVHDGKVTSLIDWQDVWAGPLLLQARHPRLVSRQGRKARIRSQVENSLVLWVYESQIKKRNPILHELSQLPQWRTIRDTVEFASNTWEGDILPFRQRLIRIARHWEEINSQVPYPINFTEDELEAHHRDGDGWNEQAEFWDSLQGLVHRDGWTSNETYDQALKMFAQLRDQGLQHLTGEERREFEQQTRWASTT